MDLDMNFKKENMKISEQQRWNVIQKMLGNISFKSVLDVGCCRGFLLNELRKNGYECYGLDIRDLKKITKKDVLSKDIYFLRADGHSIPFKKDSFDLVTTIQVIEHMQKPQKFLNEASRVLKSGGHLLIETPNFWRFSSILGRIKPEWSYKTKKMVFDALKDTEDADITDYLALGHEKEFTPKELKNMVKGANFQVITVEYTPFNAGLPPFSRFDLPKLYKILDKVTNNKLLKPFTKVYQCLLAVNQKG